MQLNKSPLNILLFKCISSMLLVQLVFTPIIYVLMVSSIPEGDSSKVGWYFVIIRTLRLITVIIASLFIRKKNNSILLNNKKQRKTYIKVIFHAIVLIAFFNMLEIIPHIAIFRNDWYDWWKELFADYLIFHILLCLTIVFSYKPKLQSSHELS